MKINPSTNIPFLYVKTKLFQFALNFYPSLTTYIGKWFSTAVVCMLLLILTLRFSLSLSFSLSYFCLVPTCRHNKTTTKLYRTVPHVTAQSWQHCAPTKTDRSFCLFSLLLRVSLINLISMNVNCLHLIRNATVFCLCVLVFFFSGFFCSLLLTLLLPKQRNSEWS